MRRFDSYGDYSEETTPLNIDELPAHTRSTSNAYSRNDRTNNKFLTWSKSLLRAPSFQAAPYSTRRGRRCWRSPRAFFAALLRVGCWVLLGLVITAIIAGWLIPSYTNLPLHYQELRDLAKADNQPGRANLNDERVFIAASLYDPDGKLLGGTWGSLVRELVDLLGPENTFVSIFESDSGDEGALALENYEKSFPYSHKFVSNDEVQLEHPAIITLPDGAESVRRIEYLAQARNRALKPLTDRSAPKYDKILFLNDVIFDPVEAAQLLFSTNIQSTGRTQYKAACAQDFKSPFLMYDMLATRDADGWQLGVPLFPWFSTASSAKSRSDVMNQFDAVEVKSCWGGMVAFDAKYFQRQNWKDQNIAVNLPLRFRAEEDLFHESSECCLIHADLIEAPTDTPTHGDTSTQVFMNPYVRTAYDESTFNWLWLGRRTERLLPPIQRMITYYAGLPYWNARRQVKHGEPLEQILYHQRDPKKKGSWRVETAPAHPGSYCAIVNLMVKRLDRDKQKANWETIGPETRDEMLKAIQHA